MVVKASTVQSAVLESAAGTVTTPTLLIYKVEGIRLGENKQYGIEEKDSWQGDVLAVSLELQI